MSSHIAQRNERHSRLHALVLAVALHLALAALLYLQTSETSTPQLKKSEPVKQEKERPVPKARAVNMP